MINITDENIRPITRFFGEEKGLEDLTRMDRLDDVNALFKVIANSLTKEQLIALVEEIGLGVVEWHEFDAEDESTWPNGKSQYLCKVEDYRGYCIAEFSNGVFAEYVSFGTERLHGVKYWQEVKQPKEK